MGRWAQQRKRGGHVGAAAGLPAGPDFAYWTLVKAGASVYVQWVTNGPVGQDFWISRWRVPSVSMLWTPTGDEVATTLAGGFQTSPFAAVVGVQQDCETAFADGDGNPISGWTGYQSIVP